MERKSARIKIKQSATVRRLRFLIGVALAAALLCFLTGSLFAALWKSTWGIVFAVASFFFFAALLFWGVLFAIELVKTMKEAGRYAFAVTNTASFECFGPFLAMNVTFFDGTGALREGRSRFLFGARDVEAWQNVPLEIAYIKSAGERAEKNGREKGSRSPMFRRMRRSWSSAPRLCRKIVASENRENKAAQQRKNDAWRKVRVRGLWRGKTKRTQTPVPTFVVEKRKKDELVRRIFSAVDIFFQGEHKKISENPEK